MGSGRETDRKRKKEGDKKWRTEHLFSFLGVNIFSQISIYCSGDISFWTAVILKP